jgi:hypothetical protein
MSEKIIAKSKDGTELIKTKKGYRYGDITFIEDKNPKGKDCFRAKGTECMRITPVAMFGYFVQTYKGERVVDCRQSMLEAVEKIASTMKAEA